ncbi:MAG: DUF6282 family protein [Actinomycetota bacterium]|nr:DUF6282 family protein [Actinomycetota bacterium]
MRPDFLTGAIDLHIHSGPDVVERIGTSIDIARSAADAGMRAIVLKDHAFPSFTKAVLTDQAVDGISVYGGIALNTTVGGLNVRSAKGAIAGGARVLMFPTYDLPHTANSTHRSRLQAEHGFGEPYVSTQIVDDDGRLTPESERIVEVAAENPHVILSNGHVEGRGAVPIMERARDLGATRLIVEHPNGHPDWFTEDELKRLIAAGAKFNISYNPYNPVMGKRSFREVVEIIQFLDPANCCLITDGGQPYNAMPHITLNVFCEMLYVEGVPLKDIMTMTKVTPALMLGLEPIDA